MTVTFKNYKIDTDSHGFAVSKVGKNEKGEDYERTLGFPSTFDGAVNMIANNLMHTQNKVVEIREYLDEYRKIKEEIATACTP